MNDGIIHWRKRESTCSDGNMGSAIMGRDKHADSSFENSSIKCKLGGDV